MPTTEKDSLIVLVLCFWFLMGRFWATPGSAGSLLLALFLGIIPSGALHAALCGEG